MDSYTKLLMHMNDSTFKDSCGHTVTNYSAAFNSGIKKFGNGSAYFNGSAVIAATYDSNINLASGNFTIDWWQYQISKTSSNDKSFSLGSGSYAYQCQLSLICSTLGFRLIAGSKSGTTYAISYTMSPYPSLGVWHHIAITRNGNYFYVYVDGVNVGSAYYVSDLYLVSGALYIGGSFNGYIDEFRISKGIVRWTSNFTPPTRQYDSTNYLFCNKNNQIINYNTINNSYICLGSISNYDSLNNLISQDRTNLNTYFNNCNLEGLSDIPSQYNPKTYFKSINTKYKILYLKK
jgi:hypothetical protein